MKHAVREKGIATLIFGVSFVNQSWRLSGAAQETQKGQRDILSAHVNLPVSDPSDSLSNVPDYFPHLFVQMIILFVLLCDLLILVWCNNPGQGILYIAGQLVGGTSDNHRSWCIRFQLVFGGQACLPTLHVMFELPYFKHLPKISTESLKAVARCWSMRYKSNWLSLQK